ncbi:MAG: alpha/beta fold hydrolase [Chloroflexi bacterium]|nr:alpha/beta fold hydrolase [Chloroflexota bacterium]
MVTKDVVLEVDGLKLAGRLYAQEDTGRDCPVVCLCHGIPAGTTPSPDDGGYPLLAERICSQGFTTFIFNFRGTGASEGNLDILGWTRDLKAVIDYLCALAGVSRISLVGFSAGAAVSVFAAAQDKRVSSVAACACPAEFSFLARGEDGMSLIEHFRSIGAIRDKDFPPSIEEWVDNFRSVTPINFAARIAPRPLLLVHGSLDERVAVSHAYRLYETAGEPKQLVIIDGAGHRLRHDDRAVAAILRWLKSQCHS